MSSQIKQFSVQAPSNIAFIKYWGKHGRQLPNNPSLSMTLKKCVTKFDVQYELTEINQPCVDFLFEGEIKIPFKERIENYLMSIDDIYPLAKKLKLQIESSNSFPHSAGIASSASAMAALGHSLAYIEAITENKSVDDLPRRASFLARLASGSACRSLEGPFVVWGKSIVANSSDEYGLVLDNVHPVFTGLKDSVLIVSKTQKSVSSSTGHQLMNGHFYSEGRKVQAQENFRTLLAALTNGNLKDFGEIIENEALSLHALMMSSYPSYILLAPESLQLIQEIRKGREETGLPMYFTIDAGPNIHLIYPAEQADQVRNFIVERLQEYCVDIIHDEAGCGVVRVNG